MTTLAGKSGFAEDHDLSLGTGTYTGPGPLKAYLAEADCVFGIGTSFTRTFLTTPRFPTARSLFTPPWMKRTSTRTM